MTEFTPATTSTDKRITVLVAGTMIRAASLQDIVDEFCDHALRKAKYCLLPAASHSLSAALRDEHLREIVKSFCVVPDGVPVWLCARLLTKQHAEQFHHIRGHDLMHAILFRAQAQSLPVFFYGPSSEVVERMQAKIQHRYPRLLIAGTRIAPMFTPRPTNEEMDQLAQDVLNSRASMVFCAVGSPKQELVAYELSKRVSCAIGVFGAAFLYESGLEPMAPKWAQKCGFEWCFRLLNAPKKLWRRYLLDIPQLFLAILAQLLRER